MIEPGTDEAVREIFTPPPSVVPDAAQVPLPVRCAFVRLVDPRSLLPNPGNPNRHPLRQIEKFIEILRYQGWRRPITVSKRSGLVTRGHGALEAALTGGFGPVPVDEQEYDSDESEIADMIADNQLARMSEMDIGALDKLMTSLQTLDQFDIRLTGFTSNEVQKITNEALRNNPKEGLTDPDDVPENAETRCKPGDLWILGEHRLFCGDSTDLKCVEKLMGGEKADIFLTDPPYGVSYADKNKYLNSISRGNRIQVAIENDHGSIEEAGAVWLSAYTAALKNCADDASFYIFSPQGGDLMMMMMIQDAGWTLKHMLVWVKNNHVLGRCDYHYKHEPIFYGWARTHKFYGGSSCFSVLQYPKPLKNDLHPTMKPVELLQNLVTNSSQIGGRVLDLFLGSGSTLIASEKTSRKCFGMEIDPHYCDVVIERWEKFTGKTALKENQAENIS